MNMRLRVKIFIDLSIEFILKSMFSFVPFYGKLVLKTTRLKVLLHILHMRMQPHLRAKL